MHSSSSPLFNSPTTRLLIVALSSHLSNQKDGLLFLPTTHLQPRLKTSLTLAIADRVLEHIRPRKPLVEFLLRVYFWAKTQARKEFFLCKISSWTLQGLILRLSGKEPKASFLLRIGNFPPTNKMKFLFAFRWTPKTVPTQPVHYIGDF